MSSRTVALHTAIVTVSTTGGQSYRFEARQRASVRDPYWAGGMYGQEPYLREPMIEISWSGQDWDTLEYFFPTYTRYGADFHRERVGFKTVDKKNVSAPKACHGEVLLRLAEDHFLRRPPPDSTTNPGGT